MSVWVPRVLAVAWGIVLVGGGCGGGPEIKGVVTLDDKPLDNVTLRFDPYNEADRTNLSVGAAVTDSQGAFRIEPQAGGETLKPGKYGVTFSRMLDTQGKVAERKDQVMLQMSGQGKQSVPAKYVYNPAPNAQAVEMVEIKEGTNDLKFNLKSQ